jgi:hypothetical protein
MNGLSRFREFRWAAPTCGFAAWWREASNIGLVHFLEFGLQFPQQFGGKADLLGRRVVRESTRTAC